MLKEKAALEQSLQILGGNNGGSTKEQKGASVVAQDGDERSDISGIETPSEVSYVHLANRPGNPNFEQVIIIKY